MGFLMFRRLNQSDLLMASMRGSESENDTKGFKHEQPKIDAVLTELGPYTIPVHG